MGMHRTGRDTRDAMMTDCMWEVKERKDSNMTPGFLTCLVGEMAVSLTELRSTQEE